MHEVLVKFHIYANSTSYVLHSNGVTQGINSIKPEEKESWCVHFALGRYNRNEIPYHSSNENNSIPSVLVYLS